MERLPLISVIIPVYNVEKYLKECLNSVVEQTYQNKEVILVDDGSADLSGAICDEFANQFSFVKVFHIENNGVANARNIGIENSSGEYIVFVDSDDILAKTYIDEVYASMVKNDSDYVQTAILKLVNGKDNGIVDYIKSDIEKMDIEDYLSRMADFQAGAYWGGNVNKFFKADIISKNHIRFESGVGFAEDFRFNLEYLKYVDKIAVVHSPIYLYRIDTVGSLSKVKRDFHKFWDEYYELYNRYVVVYKLKACYKENKQKLDNFLIKAYYDTLRSNIRQNLFKVNTWFRLDKYIRSNIQEKALLPKHFVINALKFWVLEVRFKLKGKGKCK